MPVKSNIFRQIPWARLITKNLTEITGIKSSRGGGFRKVYESRPGLPVVQD